MIDFNAQEIVLRLEPVGKPLGRRALEASVYAEYASNSRLRFVQELCGLVGGETVYVESAKDGRACQTVPVSGWRRPGFMETMQAAADFVNRAFDQGCTVTVFGSTRARWKLSVKCSSRTHDAMDNQSDRVTGGEVTARPVVEPNGIRTDF